MALTDSSSGTARLAVRAARQGLSARAVVIGLLASVAVCFVVAWAELVVTSIQIAICQFAPAAIGMLLFVILLNLALGRLWRRLGLRSQEIAYIYLMILITALTVSRGVLERWIGALVAVNYYATPGNHWQDLFFRHIPDWAVPWDPRGDAQQPVVRLFYEGVPPGQPLPWQAWLRPLGYWLIVVGAFLAAYLALASLLRRQWIDNEKLTFPLVQLPVELARDAETGGRFFRNRLTWIGFALPTLIFTLNGLHGIYPGIPQLPLSYNLGQAFANMGRPFNQSGLGGAYLSLAAIGFAYFLPTQLLFSLWVFFWLSAFQNMVFGAFGVSFEAMPLYPTSLWNGYQVAGAYVVLTAYLLRSAWPHLREMWARVWTGEPPDQVPEMMSARASFAVLASASTVAVAWFVQFGMSPAMAVIEVVVFLFVVVLVMARSVSEAGMLMTETSFRPVDLVRLVTTRTALGARNLTALSMADAVFTRDLRGNLVSTFLDGLKMSDMLNFSRRHFLLAAVLALAVALGMGGFLHLYFPYTRGAIGMYSYVYSGNPLWGFQSFQGALTSPDRYDGRLPLFFASGIGISIFLAYMRMVHVWWPLYPLGFALSGSWTMVVFWAPILVAWLLKSVIMKYGGWRIYNTLRPVFLGLILGEFSQAVIWATIAGIWRVPAPAFPWP